MHGARRRAPGRPGRGLRRHGKRTYLGTHLDEKLGAGPYAASARFDASNNLNVREVAYYVVP